MKKNIWILFTAVLALFIINSCVKKDSKLGNNQKPKKYTVTNNLKNLTLRVKEGTVSSTELTLILENNTTQECTYGEHYVLEEVTNKWKEVPVIIEEDYGFEEISYYIEPRSKAEWKVDWEWLYGDLDRGKYRIVKEIWVTTENGDKATYYLAAEFQIG